MIDLSFYAPSFRLKRLAWSGYGFGHTTPRRPGDLRGTFVGRQGRFRSLGIILRREVLEIEPER
jgi:hypothetical protein